MQIQLLTPKCPFRIDVKYIRRKIYLCYLEERLYELVVDGSTAYWKKITTDKQYNDMPDEIKL